MQAELVKEKQANEKTETELRAAILDRTLKKQQFH
jgi:hypothetical protein